MPVPVAQATTRSGRGVAASTALSRSLIKYLPALLPSGPETSDENDVEGHQPRCQTFTANTPQDLSRSQLVENVHQPSELTFGATFPHSKRVEG